MLDLPTRDRNAGQRQQYDQSIINSHSNSFWVVQSGNEKYDTYRNKDDTLNHAQRARFQIVFHLDVKPESHQSETGDKSKKVTDTTGKNSVQHGGDEAL